MFELGEKVSRVKQSKSDSQAGAGDMEEEVRWKFAESQERAGHLKISAGTAEKG